MKKAISVLFLFAVSFLALHAQDDYHIRQARSYQREAEYYTIFPGGRILFEMQEL